MKIKSLNISFKSNNIENNKTKPRYQTYYENPIDRKTERNLAILNSSLTSLAIGGLTAGATLMAQEKKNWKLPAALGAAASALTMAIILPSALYNIKVKAFTREKEMDVFSRSQEAKSSILEGVNDQIHDESVPFDDKVKNYATVQMANNGRGVMIMNGKV